MPVEAFDGILVFNIFGRPVEAECQISRQGFRQVDEAARELALERVIAFAELLRIDPTALPLVD